jgi:cobalt-zinc-cadmium efflux system outer membrane protein
LFLAIVFASPSFTEAQIWTEADVLAMAREGSPDVVRARGRVESTAELRAGAGRYPDPQLFWQRQAVPDGLSQDVIALTVPLDFAGRRAAARTVVDSMTAFDESRAVDERSRVLAAALMAFYEGVAARERITIAERAVEALEDAHRTIARREEEGTAAGMDSVRLNLELELARSQLATSHIEARNATLRLTLILGRVDADRVELAGDLDVAEPPTLARLLDESVDQPVLEALRRARSLANDAVGSAATAWIPPISLTGGLNVETLVGTEIGYFAGITLNMPFFNQGREVMANADAQTTITDTELDARGRRAAADVIAAHQRLVAVRAEAIRLGDATEGMLESLLRAANTGYIEGRRSLVELLDARRAAITVANRRLDLRLDAKSAEIDLRRATGALR